MDEGFKLIRYLINNLRRFIMKMVLKEIDGEMVIVKVYLERGARVEQTMKTKKPKISTKKRPA